MFKLCITDYLMIRQVANPIITPWSYRIKYYDTFGNSIITITSENMASATHKLLEITSATFLNYIGKELNLEIYNTNTLVILERDTFLISGVYNRFAEVQRTVRLLGENLKKTASNSSDWQDGYLRSQTLKTYQEAAMTNELESYDFTQTFAEDYTPDARYQTYRISQKESS
jgi:hypothetical protein